MAVVALALRPDIIAKLSEEAMKTMASTVVAVARNGAAPLPPKKDSPPPKADPRPPLPDCIRTTAIRRRQTMIWIISRNVNTTHLSIYEESNYNKFYIFYQVFCY